MIYEDTKYIWYMPTFVDCMTTLFGTSYNALDIPSYTPGSLVRKNDVIRLCCHQCQGACLPGSEGSRDGIRTDMKRPVHRLGHED